MTRVFRGGKIWLAIVAVVLIGIAGIYLALVAAPERIQEAWSRWIGQPRFDQVGGSEFVLEANPGEVASSALTMMRDAIRASMRLDRRIDIGDISILGGRVSFFVEDPALIGEARRRVDQVIGSERTRSGWSVELTDSTRFVLVPQRLDRAGIRVMEKAREIVERRAREIGAPNSEAIRQGGRRLIVRVPGLRDPHILQDWLVRSGDLRFKLVDETADPAQLERGFAPPGSLILPYSEGGGRIAVRNATALSGDGVVDARMERDGYDAPGIVVQFDRAGTKRFAQVSTENVGKRFAIIVDKQVISAPSFREPILGGVARIDGGFTTDSANRLAILLRSGRLPVSLRVVEVRRVTPK